MANSAKQQTIASNPYYYGGCHLTGTMDMDIYRRIIDFVRTSYLSFPKDVAEYRKARQQQQETTTTRPAP